MILLNRLRSFHLLHRTIELSKFAQVIFSSLVLLAGLSVIGTRQTITSLELGTRSFAPSAWVFAIGIVSIIGLVWIGTRSDLAQHRLQAENAALRKEIRRQLKELEDARKSVAQVRERLDRDIRPQLVRLDGLAWVLSEDHREGISPDGRVLLHRLRERTRSLGTAIDGISSPSQSARSAAPSRRM
ncbi:MAG TPA: hypothetical protein PKO15_17590 [Fibrobacteria bacterium]|nr:hypothetical protein [Fibrobacteria bacterium]HOX51376.1 hypothetical protein [Fibrobacteria bacterium]